MIKKYLIVLIFVLIGFVLLAQNENPYMQFGYEAPLMKNDKETKDRFGTFVVFNSDTTSDISWLIFDVKNRKVGFYSKYGILHYSDTIAPIDIARWLKTDPANQYHSPYIGMGNNPVNLIDPNGATTNPIYDWNGNRLGTDELGLQGEAIFMNASDFTQGMSHETAMNVGKTIDNMSWEQAFSLCNNGAFDRFISDFNSLPSRMDYSTDFVLTKAIADRHWQNGGGPLYVNEANIDLPGVTTADFTNGQYTKNFAWGRSNTGQVYGTLDMTLLDPNTGAVSIGYVTLDVSPNGLVLDYYDFSYDGSVGRNIATWWGKPSGNGRAFDIHGYGTASIPVVK